MKFFNLVVMVWKLVARYPALSAGVAQIIILVGTKIGLHLTTEQLTTLAGIIAAVFALLVHSGVIPVTKVANVKAGLKPTVPAAVEVGEPASVMNATKPNPVIVSLEGK